MLKLHDYLESRKRNYVELAVRRCHGDPLKAAVRLGISLTTLYHIVGPISDRFRTMALMRRPPSIDRIPSRCSHTPTLLVFFGVDPSLAEVNPSMAIDRAGEGYRRMSKILHPDSPTGDPAKMGALNAAWKALTRRLEQAQLSHSGLNRGRDWQVECEAGAGECRAPVTDRL